MDATSVVELLESAGAAVAVARLTWLKLDRRFPALFVWLIVRALIDFSLSLLPQRSIAYFWVYVCAEPIACVFGVFAVRELLGIVFRDYRGISSMGRWVTYAGVSLAIISSVAFSMLVVRDPSHGSIHLYYIEVAQRSTIFALAVVIISVLFVLSRYPLHLAHNSLVSALFFSVIFLTDAARLLIDSLATRLNNRTVDLTEAPVIFLCLGTWQYCSGRSL